MLTRFLHIPTPPGSAHRAFPFLRTETAFQAVPVFRMAYFLQTAHCAVCRKTLMLQVRFAHPPSAHRNAPSEHSGVPVGLFYTKSTQYSLLQNARPSGSLRSPSDAAPNRLFELLRCSQWAGEASLSPCCAPTHLRCAGVPPGLLASPNAPAPGSLRSPFAGAPTHLRCAGVSVGLFSEKAFQLFLQNARPPAASRPSVGGGSFAPPCTPLSHHPRTAGRSDAS